MFCQTTIPLVPTVTIPLAQFNLMKRALSAAWLYRERQLEEPERFDVSPTNLDSLKKECDLWRQLEGQLNAEI